MDFDSVALTCTPFVDGHPSWRLYLELLCRLWWYSHSDSLYFPLSRAAVNFAQCYPIGLSQSTTLIVFVPHWKTLRGWFPTFQQILYIDLSIPISLEILLLLYFPLFNNSLFTHFKYRISAFPELYLPVFTSLFI